jgi:hypothetical protein
LAVIVPAAKLPEPSRATRVLGVLLDVAEPTPDAAAARLAAEAPPTVCTVLLPNGPTTSPARIGLATGPVGPTRPVGPVTFEAAPVTP